MGPLDLTHTLVAGRVCGACFACCETAQIDDPALAKPAHVLCPHHQGGCTVYEHRPATCRTFHCLWRRVAGLPQDGRPDQSGVLFSFQREAQPDSPFAHVYVAGYATGDVAAYDTPGVRAAIEHFIAEAGLPVWLSYGARKRLVWPDKTLGDAIVNPAAVTDPALAARAAAWTKRYDRWVRMYDMAGG
jgi:hypothetical protein